MLILCCIIYVMFSTIVFENISFHLSLVLLSSNMLPSPSTGNSGFRFTPLSLNMAAYVLIIRHEKVYVKVTTLLTSPWEGAHSSSPSPTADSCSTR